MMREPRSSSLVSSKLLIPGKTVGLGNPNVVENDVGVLHGAQRDLVLDPAAAHPGQGRVHDEAADRAVGLVPRPHQHVVAERAVADPPLGAVQHPAVPAAVGLSGTARYPARPRLHAAGDVGAVVRFGQGKRTRGPEVRGVAEVPAALVLGAEPVERFDEEVVVDHEKRGDRRVHARHLRDHQPREQVTVAALGGRAQLQRGQLGQDVRRKFGLVPPVPGERRDLRGQELPQFAQLPLF
jgi:hypothetical protein